MMDRGGEEIRITPQRGTTGGVAPAAAEWPVVGVERVRWGAVWAGLLVAIATQMVLSAFGLAVGLYGTTGQGVGATPNWSALGLWTAVWGLISLFLGGWVSARLAGSPTAANGTWHGVVVWALALALGTLLGALGITGLLGFLPGRMTAMPGVAPTDITNTAWGFFAGALIGLAAAAIGGAVGRRRDEADVRA